MYKTPVVVEAVSFVENRRHVSVFQWIYNNIMIIIIRTHKCSLTFIRILLFLEHMWRRQWQPTPVLLPGKSHRRRSLVGCSPWGHWELDMTEQLHFHFHALEKEMATHSSVLAWRIPGLGEPGGLPSMGSHRVGHN